MRLDQFFILGNPRSGTSLLRLMLNSHSAITVAPECGFLLWLYPKYKQWNVKHLNHTFIQQFADDVCTSKKFETWGVTSDDLIDTINTKEPKNYESLAQCVYLSFARKFNKIPLVLGDKNNYYIEHLSLLDTLFKNKRILHIIRDGRDVAASYKKLQSLSSGLKYKPDLSLDIVEIAKEWQTHNLNIHEYFKNKSNYYIIKYEDILLNTENTLQPFLSDLGLDFELNMLAFYQHNKENKIEPDETIAWKLKTLEPLDRNNIGTHRTVLLADEIRAFNVRAKKSLKHFGYES